MIRRINLFGAPCSGKSTIAAHTFSKLKLREDFGDLNFEMIQEKAKEWSYENRVISKYDQLTLFAKQIEREYRVLNSSKNNIIITDSPVLLAVYYAKKVQFIGFEELQKISQDFDNEYRPLNIFIEQHPDSVYNESGRYETSNEALIIKKDLYRFMGNYCKEYNITKTEQSSIHEYINNVSDIIFKELKESYDNKNF